jgi:CRP-like cAMP-binding protein/glyoxylase-like metal-dependent hydrolase (beta-lactamase superfamily II)
MGTGKSLELLPRGGALVETSAGPVQFGAVPETIKDTLHHEAGVPRIYVIPPRLFSVERGISFADLEFPIYFNFFALKRKIVVVCEPAQRRILANILREAIFGPQRIDLGPDLPATRPARAIPDLVAELAFFRQHPARPGTEMTLDDMVTFVPFDRDGIAPVESVRIHRDGHGCFRIEDRGTIIAEIGQELTLPPLLAEAIGDDSPFVPPYFGITFIGTGHGFDPNSKTSGCILWVNGRGIMVDPPVDSTEWLYEHGINPKLIDSLILTHCHADHDSGTLQMILAEGRIKLYTTRTILGSFTRKYRALIGLDKRRFEDLFDFVPLTVDEPIPISGGEFWFHYTLHSVPAIGFELYCGGKSLVYTSDTLHDPPTIEQMFQRGILSEDRRSELLNFPWHHDLIIHEAGIPPIHTRASFLEELPADVKERMLLVHTQKKDLPEGSGLKVAPAGLRETVTLEAKRAPATEAIQLLDVLARVDLFREFPLNKAGEFLGMVRKMAFKAGDRIITKGTPGDRFYVIQSGKAAVRDGDRHSKIYGPFDYFGETAIILDIMRTADVYAVTDMTVLALERHDFLYFLRGSTVANTLRHLARMRLLDSWELLDGGEAFGQLTATQITQLQLVMRDETCDAGRVLLDEGQAVRDGFLVGAGLIELVQDGAVVGAVGRGAFLGELGPLYSGGKSCVGYRARTPAVVYRLARKDLMDYLKKNPGLYVRLASYRPVSPMARLAPTSDQPIVT